MGADVVVAVDLSPTLREGARPEGLRDIVTATMLVAANSTQIGAREAADFLVQPDIEEFMPWDFGRADELREAGRRAAAEIVDRVLASLE
jgi:predicted acylesterase/phospholipase RssA